MSKYENSINYLKEEEKVQLIEGENIIWSGKPKKSAFIINKLAPALPFVIIWLVFDLFFIYTYGILSKFQTGTMLYLIPFFIMHMLPIGSWVASSITSGRRWKNTKYYVTDKRIIIQNGFIAENYQTIYYKDIKNVTLHVGAIDKLLGVGDIYFSVGASIIINSGTYQHNYNACFLDVEEYQELYPKLQKVILDIQTDIEYPNEFRPQNNPGYNTKYNP